MGLMSEVARGNADFVNADVETISDSRNWKLPKWSRVAINPMEGFRQQSHDDVHVQKHSTSEE